MSDFAKAKIIFALAIVGVLFAIHPIVRDFGDAGFAFFGSVLQFRIIYYALLALVGCVIYFYAVDFITENPMGFAHRIGNLFYAMALLFPPVLAVVYMSIKVAEGVVWVSDSPLAGEVSKIILTSIAAGFGLLIAQLISRRMNVRDREENVDRLAFQARGHLQRAEELLDSGHNDLVALEAFRAIESALQRSLLNGKINVPTSRANQLIPIAAKAGVIPDNLVGVFHELRIARNRAVHGMHAVPDQDASWFLETSRKMLGAIRAADSEENKDEEESLPAATPVAEA